MPYGLITEGLGGSLGPLLLEGLGSGDTGAVDLEHLLAGENGTNVPSPWAAFPYGNFIRSSLLRVATTSLNHAEQGQTILYLGRLTELYNVVNGLDVDVYKANPTPSRQSIKVIDRGLYFVYPHVPLALQELLKAKVPQQYVDLIYRYAASDSPIVRVSGIATMLVMAAVFQLHPGA